MRPPFRGRRFEAAVSRPPFRGRRFEAAVSRPPHPFSPLLCSVNSYLFVYPVRDHSKSRQLQITARSLGKVARVFAFSLKNCPNIFLLYRRHSHARSPVLSLAQASPGTFTSSAFYFELTFVYFLYTSVRPHAVILAGEAFPPPH